MTNRRHTTAMQSICHDIDVRVQMAHDERRHVVEFANRSLAQKTRRHIEECTRIIECEIEMFYSIDTGGCFDKGE
jgi:hypothetical protein